ncbi:MAG: hypothetical protein VX897_00645 [Actinomycetota bacterium]|nr:hypothetical protein [Actinomycetota bacterium]
MLPHELAVGPHLQPRLGLVPDLDRYLSWDLVEAHRSVCVELI